MAKIDGASLGYAYHLPTGGFLMRIRNALSQFSDLFSEFNKYISPAYHHDRCERYSIPKYLQKIVNVFEQKELKDKQCWLKNIIERRKCIKFCNQIAVEHILNQNATLPYSPVLIFLILQIMLNIVHISLKGDLKPAHSKLLLFSIFQ